MRSPDASTTVTRYLDALAAHDWDALVRTLAPAVVRIGPYGDVFEGAEPYAAFLRGTVEALSGYALVVERLVAGDATVVAELNETVDDRAGRLRTHEAVVFDVREGLITRVAVYLRTPVFEE